MSKIFVVLFVVALAVSSFFVLGHKPHSNKVGCACVTCECCPHCKNAAEKCTCKDCKCCSGGNCKK